MNLIAVLAVIAQLESSNGKNMKHPGGHAHGWYGVEQSVIDDINKRHGTKYTPEDMKDYEKATDLATKHINDWLARHPAASMRDVLLMWRCGATGMYRPNQVQINYANRGTDMIARLLRGDHDWRELRW